MFNDFQEHFEPRWKMELPTPLSLVQWMYEIRKAEQFIDTLPQPDCPRANTQLRNEQTYPWIYNYLYFVMHEYGRIFPKMSAVVTEKGLQEKISVLVRSAARLELPIPIGKSNEELRKGVNDFLFEHQETKLFAQVIERAIELTKNHKELQSAWVEFPVELIVAVENTRSPICKVVLGCAGYDFEKLMDNGGFKNILTWKKINDTATQPDELTTIVGLLK